ncbi:hypothetical protein BGZ67_010616, partial [Mortierella alpina]
MVKIWIVAALALAQTCILHAEASHYIRFQLSGQGNTWKQWAGICIHDSRRVVMAQGSEFASSTKNYGFYQGELHANVNWKNQNVGVDPWGGPFDFDKKQRIADVSSWEGCWETSGERCSDFRERAYEE